MTLIDEMSRRQIVYKTDVETSAISSIRAGGKAKVCLFPKSDRELIEAVCICNRYSVKYKVIGCCSNTFFADEGYDGVIISSDGLKKINLIGDSIFAGAGVRLSKLITFALQMDKSLLPGLYGIPASVGGAVRNNAGAFGDSISDWYKSGIFYSPSYDRIIEITNYDMNFEYRSSKIIGSDLILLEACFRFTNKNKEIIKENIADVTAKRRSTQPSLPSLGSFFKRNGDFIPSRAIDELGLKGINIGGAGISRKHAGFIVNLGDAKARDIDKLASFIEAEVLSAFGVSILREAEFVK